MTAPNEVPDPERTVDEVVRAQLDAEAARTDARGLADRVLSKLANEPPAEPAKELSRPRRAWRKIAAFAGLAGLAATVLIAVFVLSGTREATASPAEVVKAARDTAAPNEARCYRVTVNLPARMRESFPLLALDAEAPRTLCTRGNRFVVEPGFGGKGAWGRDETGRVWAAPTREGAVAFDETELPAPLRTAVKIHELELTSLLDEVLTDFDLAFSEPPSRGAETYSITATRRGEAQPFRITSTELVIEKKTKVVRSLTIHRKTLNDGTATIAFALTGTAPRDDAAFTPEGHLNPGAPVYDRTKLLRRNQLLRQQLKEMANGP